MASVDGSCRLGDAYANTSAQEIYEITDAKFICRVHLTDAILAKPPRWAYFPYLGELQAQGSMSDNCYAHRMCAGLRGVCNFMQVIPWSLTEGSGTWPARERKGG
jgi:hypothetical protein